MNKKIILLFLFLASTLNGQVKFAMFGDYGCDEPGELAVSILVKSMNPDFIVTVGDNNYYHASNGDSIDHNIGRYYHEYIKPYLGNYGSGSAINRFFPAMGNHDLYDYLWYGPNDIRYAGHTYHNYFRLTDTAIHKGNTPDIWSPLGVRYYTFRKGNVQFFILNSGVVPDNHSAHLYSEPDGIDSNSVQAQWLKTQLNNSTATWKIVVLHHPPFNSAVPGYENEFRVLRWNYKQWGASVVVSGHQHTYESLVINNFPYFISGLGGEDRSLTLLPSHSGSRIQYKEKFGSLFCMAYNDSLIFRFINVDNELIDYYKLLKPQTDAGVKAVSVTNSETIYTGGTYCFNARVKNYGTIDILFAPVQYTVNGGPIVGPVATGVLNSGDSTIVSFCGGQSFMPTSPGSYTLKFYTTVTGDAVRTNDTTTLFLTVVDSSKDVGVISANSVPEIIYTGSLVSLIAKVKNFGIANLPVVPVSYTVNDSLNATVETSYTLNSQDTALVIFTQEHSFIPSAPGIYTLKFYTTLAADTARTNDTSILTLSVIDSSRDAGVTSVSTVIADPIYTGTSVSFNATIKNFGIANLPEVPVRYKIGSDTNTISLNTGAVNSGDTASLLFTDAQSFTPNAAGNYTLRFYTTLTGDTNFNNDTTTLLLTVIDSSRDAGVTSASTVIPDPIYTGTSVSFNATIKNFGIANLPEVPVRYKIDSDTNTISLNTGAVNSGDTASLLFTDAQSFTPNAAGNYTLRFYTTLTGDTNFNNDTTTLLLTVIDSSRDAGVTSASTVIPGPIYTGTSVSFNATVKNFGIANLPEVPVRFKISSDTNSISINTGAVNSGDTASLLFTDAQSFTPNAAGNYTLRFYTTLAGDTNFNNDTTTLLLTVIDSSRDAGVTSASTVITDPIYTGTSVSFNATIKNFGIANLPEVPVRYKIDSDTNAISLNTGAVNSGDTASLLFTDAQSFTPNAAGNYTLRFYTTLTGDTNF